MKTRACRGKPISDLKLALKNYIEQVEKSHATDNKKKFVPQCNVSLLYMDTDSFILEIKTSDVYEDMIDNIDIYDISNYKSGDVLFSSKNKKFIGKFKDELGGKVMSEFIGLRSKS